MQAVSAADLAQCLGLTSRRIHQLAASEIVVAAGAGQFDFAASVRNYVVGLQAKADKSLGRLDLTQQQARLAHEQAEAAAIKNARLRSDHIAIARVDAGWQEITTKVRRRLRAVPASLRARMPNLTQADLDVVKSEIESALSELGVSDV